MKKVVLFSLVLILAAGALALTAWSGHEEGNAPLDEVVATELRKLEMKAKLLEELGPDATSIDIEIHGGDVTLSGEVREPSTKKMATQIAQSFGGYLLVKNQIEVNDSSAGNAEEEVRNTLLQTRIRTKLLAELGRPALDVAVQAAGGVVSLRGKLPDNKRRVITLETARNCQGVEKVIDLLEIEGS